MREEMANAISHGFGLLFAVAAAPILIVNAVRNGGAASVVGVSIFAATLALLYLTSMLYHAMPRNRAKEVFQVLDHSAIFLLIAGTYTPFTLTVLRGAWGWSLFGVVWGIAFVGVILKGFYGDRHPKISAGLYLAMGWVVMIAIKPLWQGMTAQGFLWLLAGGIAYTVGVGFYAAKKVRYSHFIWHLFVLAGTACHFMAVLLYAS
jgi:hemolysin III